MKPVTKMIWIIIAIIIASGLFFVILDDADTKGEPEQSQPANNR